MFKPQFEGHIEKCFFCRQEWGSCECDFILDEDGFNFNEFYITRPNVSVCTRFFVDPYVYYGEAYKKWWSTRSVC